MSINLEEIRARRIRLGMIPAPPAKKAPPLPIVSGGPNISYSFPRIKKALPHRISIHLPEYIETQPRVVTVDMIKRMVCEVLHVTMTELDSNRRYMGITRPRQIAMYLAKKYTVNSLPFIGRRLGRRDHTTIIHGVRRIEELRRTDTVVNNMVKGLEERIEKLLS